MIVASVLTVAANAYAQFPGQIPGIDYQKVLLPTVVNQQQPGAFGSLWVTRVIVTNSGIQLVDAFPHDESVGHIEPDFHNSPLPPNTTLALGAGGDRGTFFFFDKRFLQNVQISLRAQDLSRQSLTWGTTIPVPKAEEFTSGTVTLNGVPTDARFRQTLRVYSLDSSKPSVVRISLYGITLNTASTLPQHDVFLGSIDRALTDLRGWLPVNTFSIPGFLEISDVNTIAPTTGFDLVRIDVQPIDGSTVWAFTSITNNETQHVTVVAPTQ
jgi:hypothetical protein